MIERISEFTFFGVAAMFIHMVAFYSAPDVGSQAGGSRGQEAVSIQGANASIQRMVEVWETPPEIVEIPELPTLKAPAILDAPEMNASANQILLPMPKPSALAKPEEKTWVPKVPKIVRKPKVKEPPKKPLVKPSTPEQEVEQAVKKPTKSSQKSNEQKSAGKKTNAFAGQGQAKLTSGVSKKKIASLTQTWGAKIKREIERKKRYPKGARKNGRVVITLVLMPTGEVLSYKVGKSSGVRALDNAALLAVNKAGVLPPAPKGLNLEKYTVSLPIIFRK